MVKTYSLKKDGGRALSAHFKVREFRSGDGTDKVLIDEALPVLLENLYQAAQGRGYKVTGIYINSGYRTAAYDKQVGGYGGGQHVAGKAADIRVGVSGPGDYTDKRGNAYFLDAKLLCCLLQDIGCQGIGYIGGVAVHADTRERRWWGDERTGNDAVRDWYAYFGVPRPGGEEAPAIRYQVYAARRWLPEVEGKSDYAGIRGQAVQGVRAQVSRGHIEYRVHTGGRWLPWVRDRADYAGLYGKNADGVQMRLVDLPGYAVEYRAAAVGREYYPWVRNYGDGANGYAGCFGKAFDRLQCRVVKE